MSAWFLVLSSAAEVIEGAVAFSIYHQAFKFYRLSGERKLLSLSTAFLVLGLGLLAHGAILAVLLFLLRSFPKMAFLLSRISSWALFACEVLAYGSLASSYFRTGSGEEAGLTLIVLSMAGAGRPMRPELLVKLVRYHPALELVVLALLSYLTYKTMSNFLSNRDMNPFLVGFAFLFLTVAHVCFFLSYFVASLYTTAHVLQLLAFICMSLMIVRVASA
ncbi:hypothetical protein DRO32_03400 [Candidatus Bathyarchaeota archaeon]|nr:MAG: hypothetical protein DRO32_03400 [Candidatus Bathyarchaeota archaeon]